MEDWQNRVVEEWRELGAKLDKLQKKLNSQGFEHQISLQE